MQGVGLLGGHSSKKEKRPETAFDLPLQAAQVYAAVKESAAYVAVTTAHGPVLIADALADEFAKKVKGERVAGFSVRGAELETRRQDL